MTLQWSLSLPTSTSSTQAHQHHPRPGTPLIPTYSIQVPQHNPRPLTTHTQLFTQVHQRYSVPITLPTPPTYQSCQLNSSHAARGYASASILCGWDVKQVDDMYKAVRRTLDIGGFQWLLASGKYGEQSWTGFLEHRLRLAHLRNIKCLEGRYQKFFLKEQPRLRAAPGLGESWEIQSEWKGNGESKMINIHEPSLEATWCNSPRIGGEEPHQGCCDPNSSN